MPRKAIFNQEDIIQAGFEVTRREGLQGLSARKLANELHASTAPVYSYIGSIDAVRKEVLKEAKTLLFEYLWQEYTDLISLNVQTGLVCFSRDEPQLFSALFLEGGLNITLIEEYKSELLKSFKMDFPDIPLPEPEVSNLIERRWIYTFGLATLTQIKAYDAFDIQNVIEFLQEFNNLGTSGALKMPGEQLSMGF